MQGQWRERYQQMPISHYLYGDGVGLGSQPFVYAFRLRMEPVLI
jgi:hypothetical protein